MFSTYIGHFSLLARIPNGLRRYLDKESGEVIIPNSRPKTKSQINDLARRLMALATPPPRTEHPVRF